MIDVIEFAVRIVLVILCFQKRFKRVVRLDIIDWMESGPLAALP